MESIVNGNNWEILLLVVNYSVHCLVQILQLMTLSINKVIDTGLVPVLGETKVTVMI
jgi:hypothetical protein